MVYLIHFASPLHHANHYIGFTNGKLQSRIEKHRKGTGAKILKAANNSGIDWKVVRTWEDGDRNFERSLKNRKKAKCLCPLCKNTIEYNGYKIIDFGYLSAKSSRSSHLKIYRGKELVRVIRYNIGSKEKAVLKAKKLIDKLSK